MRLWRAWPFTVRGTAALVVGFVAMWLAQRYNLLPLRILALLLIMLPLVALGALWLHPAERSLRRRFGTEVIPSGQDTTVELQVKTGRSNGALLQWRDTLDPGLSGQARGTASAGDQTLYYQLHAQDRGPRFVGPFVLTQTDGFGVARRHTSIGDVSRIVVAPAIVELAAFTIALHEATGALHSTTSHLGEGSDNLIARPYVAGDSMRRIHWRATAHRGELMVRQEERETTPQATVVMDRVGTHWPKQAHAFGANAAFETALSLAASAVLRLLSEGFAVELCDSNGDALCDTVVDQEDVTGMLAALAQVQPTIHGAHGAQALNDGPLVWITSHTADLAPLGALSPALPMLFVVADGAANDPAVAGWHAATVNAAAGSGGVASAWERALEGGTRVPS